MALFNLISILIVLAALFGYLNQRFFRLPNIIGLMFISILFSMGLLAAGYFFPAVSSYEQEFLGQLDFRDLLMNGMLSFLLFAAALQIDIEELKQQRLPIFIFATLGVFISTFLTGTLLFYLLGLLGFSVPYIHCLLFGALISPTDPVAVVGILKKAGIKKSLEIKITGESLFNDGIGIVVFVTLLHVAQSGGGGTGSVAWGSVALLFVQEAGGGVLLGLILGKCTEFALSTIDKYDVEVMITLAMVAGGYALANVLEFSGPIAMVIGGLFVGNRFQRRVMMSEETEQYVFRFWELIDVFFNAVLFLLVGLEILTIDFNKYTLIAALSCIPLVLLSRSISIYSLVAPLKQWISFDDKTTRIMTWGGLHGGISLALALSLPKSLSADLFITITYTVVVFSILVQGLSLQWFIGRQEDNAGPVTAQKQ